MKVVVGKEEIVLDPKNLEFDETSLNSFLMKSSGIYDYYGSRWAKAQYITYISEDKYDNLYNEKFVYYKTAEGGSDKLAEAKAHADPDVVGAKKVFREAKYMMQLLYSHLRSLDKAHEDAINLGYNVRKEMDKIFPQHIKNLPEMSADDEVAKYFTDKPEMLS